MHISHQIPWTQTDSSMSQRQIVEVFAIYSSVHSAQQHNNNNMNSDKHIISNEQCKK